jgi:hypothetical protein
VKLRSLVAAATLGLVLAVSAAPEGVAHAQNAPTPAPDPAAVTSATAAFKKGTALFNQKRHALAIVEFQKSYDTVASPNSLLYVARCQAELGQVKDAYRTFSKVIAEADARLPAEAKYQPTKDSAVAEREELGKKLALVTINVQNATDATRVTVAGTDLDRAEWGKPQPMDPGAVDVVIDGTEIKKSVTLDIGKKEVVDIDAKPPEAPVAPPPVAQPPEEESGGMSPLVPVGIAVAGVGVAGMVLFAITGSMSNGTYSDLEALCGGEQACPTEARAEAAELQDSGRTQQTLANVGLIVGAVGLAAGATLIVVGLNSDDGGADAGDETAKAPRPKTSVAFGPGSAMVKGTF